LESPLEIFFVTSFYQEKKVNGEKAFTVAALKLKYLILLININVLRSY